MYVERPVEGLWPLRLVRDRGKGPIFQAKMLELYSLGD